MTQRPTYPFPDSAGPADATAAMAAVLAAETDARREVETCRAECAAALEAARAEARRTVDRSEELALAVRGRIERIATARAAAVAAEPAPVTAATSERLATAVARLAARLTREGE